MTKLKNRNLRKNEQHPYHLVDPSPWPILTSLSLYSLALGFTTYFQYFKGGLFQLIFSLFLVIFSLFRWFYDIVAEATYEGQHTFKVQQNILLGMALFIISEGMFFFAFFWAFFHFIISPSIWIGGVWPPGELVFGPDIHEYWGSHFCNKYWRDRTVNDVFLVVFDCQALPLLNTGILIGSGCIVTESKKYMATGHRAASIFSLIITITCGLVFSVIQKYEYDHATFSINDGAYGSVFYMLTGFHGLHVIIGTVFLIICLIRHYNYHFFKKHFTGFICGTWYWHFVDAVWVVLFVVVYFWSSLYLPITYLVGEVYYQTIVPFIDAYY